MSDGLRDKLRRLRRERAVQAGPQASTPGALPPWLRARLARATPGAAAGDGARARTSGEPAGLSVLPEALGDVAVRDTLLPADARHGGHALADALAVPEGVFELLTRRCAPAAFDLSRSVFFDIETTGLSGGAGTHVFLVGLGWFEGERFRVRQAFLRGPEEERALLAACARWIGAGAGLVSFFGKSFDRHRLEDKMRQHGVAPPFEGLPHVDLYWPCRRLYGAVAADTRLATMERLACGVAREGDLPGAFAPAAWFDFLAGRPHLLEPVFRHNLDDVLSLVTLAAHAGALVAGGPEGASPAGLPAEMHAARASALAALYLERRERAAGLAWIEAALRHTPPGGRARSLRLRRARELARQGEAARALGELQALLDEGTRDEAAARAALDAGRLRWRLERDAAGAVGLARRALELARATTSGSARAGLEAAAEALIERCARGR